MSPETEPEAGQPENAVAYKVNIDPRKRKSSSRTLLLLAALVLIIGLATESMFALAMGGLSLVFALIAVITMKRVAATEALHIGAAGFTATEPLVPRPVTLRFEDVTQLRMDTHERLYVTTAAEHEFRLGMHHLSDEDRSDARKRLARLTGRKIIRV